MAWQARTARIMGRSIPVPRLTAWYGDRRYGYSGIVHEPLPWTGSLLELKTIAEKFAGISFNSVLLNLYRNGRDSMSWHADDERSLGSDPVIASVSLGAERVFQLRHHDDPTQRLSLSLPHGSCLIMAGGIQAHWRHQLPKTAKPIGPRINLTFRSVVS